LITPELASLPHSIRLLATSTGGCVDLVLLAISC
jgi:hypothetical protein